MWLTDQEALDFTGRPDIVVPDGYNRGQVVSVLAQLRIRVSGVDTDHGGPPPGNKPSACSIDYPDAGRNLDKRAHFDRVLSDRNLVEIFEPLESLAAIEVTNRNGNVARHN
jgi:hypothetical protein